MQKIFKMTKASNEKSNKSQTNVSKRKIQMSNKCQTTKLKDKVQAVEEWQEEDTRATNVAHGINKGSDAMAGLHAFVEGLFAAIDAAKEDFETTFPYKHKEELWTTNMPRTARKTQTMEA